MTLSEWLNKHKISDGKFATKIGTSAQAVLFYRRRLRTPRPDIMAKITEATKGAVQPNDFYAGASE